MPVFLFTDIEGSTEKWSRFPRAMQEALVRHDAIVEAQIVRYGGKGLSKGQPAPEPGNLGTPMEQPGKTTVFDQRGQTVGTQTNIAGNVTGPVLSGQFDGPVALGGGEAVDMRGSQGRSTNQVGR